MTTFTLTLNLVFHHPGFRKISVMRPAADGNHLPLGRQLMVIRLSGVYVSVRHVCDSRNMHLGTRWGLSPTDIDRIACSSAQPDHQRADCSH